MKIKFYHPKQNEITIIELKNFEFLPLFYLFPKELLKEKCPSLLDMPRSAHGIFKQKKWLKVFMSDFFLKAVCDLTAFFVWQAFGISTSMECFSGHDPLWRLAHATPLWEEAFEHMSGITPQSLADTPKKEHEWLELEEFQNLMLQIGFRGIVGNELQPCIQAIRAMRCAEDYDKRYSNAKIDFHRKWYHTRTRFKTVSLDRLIEGHGSDTRGDAVDAVLGDFIDDPPANFEEAICSRIDAESFCETLSPRDRKILEMRVRGATYQEIADKLAYKTHSAVIKRIRRIAEQYLDDVDEQEGTREFLRG